MLGGIWPVPAGAPEHPPEPATKPVATPDPLKADSWFVPAIRAIGVVKVAPESQACMVRKARPERFRPETYPWVVSLPGIQAGMDVIEPNIQC